MWSAVVGQTCATPVPAVPHSEPLRRCPNSTCTYTEPTLPVAQAATHTARCVLETERQEGASRVQFRGVHCGAKEAGAEWRGNAGNGSVL